jgi:hypothetical protein
MTVRFFYTDALAAAWMMKHFGMRFVNHNNGIEITLENVLRHALTGNICGIHIHPDSLYLLEPQSGDIVNYLYAGGSHLTGGFGVEYLSHDGVLEEDEKVILRNGVPFHWPHSEDA